MNKQIEWFKQTEKIHNGLKATCPNCGSKNTEYEFYAFEDGGGYGEVWCNDCNDRAHISRIKYPEYTKAKITNVN